MPKTNPVNIVSILNEQKHIKTIMCNGMRWYYDASVPDEDKVFRASMTSGISKVYPKGDHFFDIFVHNMQRDQILIDHYLV